MHYVLMSCIDITEFSLQKELFFVLGLKVKCGVSLGKCVGVWGGEKRWGGVKKCRGGVGKCVGVYREVKKMWGSMKNVGKYVGVWGSENKCGEVC